MSKVMVIGLDGATLDLIKPWADEGKLPNIAKLMKESAYGELESTYLPFTAPAWVSFMTGKNPGKHGVYDFMGKKGGSYKRVPSTTSSIKEPVIWKLINDKDKRTILVNIPMTYPAYKVDGVMISGFPAPPTADDLYYPPGLMDELEDYKFFPETTYSEDTAIEYINECLDIVEKRTNAVIHLMQNKEWDFFMVVYMLTDSFAHYFWKYMDKDHPMHVNNVEIEPAIQKAYMAVDKAIGRIMEAMDEDTSLIIMSDHGATGVHKSLYLNLWLHEKGYLNFKKTPLTLFKLAMFKAGINLSSIYSIASKLNLAKRGRTAVQTKEGVAMLDLLLSFNDIEWKNTKAYSTGNYGPIYINLKGREPDGCVEPGKEFDELRSKLKKELKTIKDDGKDVITDIKFKEEVFNGAALNDAPDILYQTRDMKYVSARFFEFGHNKLFGAPFRKTTGGHKRNGIFFAKGNGIKPGTVTAKIEDVTPTILQLMGIEIPDDFDGKVIDIFKSKQTVQKETSRKRNEREEKKLSPEEEQQIIDRLSNLGYIT